VIASPDVPGLVLSRLISATPPIVGHVISPIGAPLVFFELRKARVLCLHVRGLDSTISLFRFGTSPFFLFNHALHPAVRLAMLVDICLGYHLSLHSCDSHSATAASAH